MFERGGLGRASRSASVLGAVIITIVTAIIITIVITILIILIMIIMILVIRTIVVMTICPRGGGPAMSAHGQTQVMYVYIIVCIVSVCLWFVVCVVESLYLCWCMSVCVLGLVALIQLSNLQLCT